MVESEAKELSEDIMLEAVMFGHRGFQPVIEAIIRLAERSSREPRDFQPKDHSAVYAAVKKQAEADLRKAYAIAKKEARQDAVAAAKDKVKAALLTKEDPAAPSPSRPSARTSSSLKPTSCATTSSTRASASMAATPRRCARSSPKPRPAAHPRLGPVHPR
jgi:polyribonucleotide nucleotidyltransferase